MALDPGPAERGPALSPEPLLLLARVAGIPAASIEQLGSDLCAEWLPVQATVEGELAAVRAELVERLYGLIGPSPPDLRRFLLAVKRDAFNGRSIAGHRADSRWSELARLTGPLADRLAALEERRESWRDGYAAAYRIHREREHRELLRVLGDPGFGRGLALASPALATAAAKARGTGWGTAAGRRGSRLDLGLLRYVSRAALKLSPFSSLTRIALGTVGGAERLAWAPGGWSERSLVRLRRYLAEEIVELLCRYRPLRERLELALNPTLEESAPERYRFLRPDRRVPDEESGKLRHESAALVEMSLPRALVSGVFSRLGEAPRAYRDLAAALADDLGGAAEPAAATLEALLAAGVLLLRTPWLGNEPHLEKRLLSSLRALPADPGLTATLDALARLVSLQEGYSGSADPGPSLAEIEQALDDVWRNALHLADLAPGVERTRSAAGDLCEDVLLVSTRTGQEVFQVSRQAVREIVRSARPWAQLIAFQGYRFDFLHTLAAFMERRWPGREEVEFLELFAAAQPLWRDYRKLTSSESGAWRSAFNPLALPEIASTAALRAELWAGLRDTLQDLPGGADLPLAALEGLAARIPERYAWPVGPCLFVQPAAVDGGLWVLNRLFEGTGRHGSRFTAVMDEDTRRRYTGRYLRAARREVEGEPAELLDLMWSHRDTLNVHAVQTARVLALPGETLDRRVAEPVELRDLRVAVDGATGWPRLADASGRRLLPVHLGATAASLMPFLIQFLAQWGPAEIRPPLPPRLPRRLGSVQVLERVTAGCLVLARRRWVASLGESLRREAAEASEEDAFLALNHWRLEQNLPECLFWIEKVHHDIVGPAYKPQFLDFSSPLCVEVFRSALRSNGDPLTLEEALPAPGDLPPGPGGEGRWAFELQLDTLPLGPEDLAAEGAGELEPWMVSTSSAAGGGAV